MFFILLFLGQLLDDSWNNLFILFSFQEPRLDPECNQFKDFLVDHPCLNAKYKETDPFPVDALPTCNHAQQVCSRDKVCSKKMETFTRHCPVKHDQCVMTDV